MSSVAIGARLPQIGDGATRDGVLTVAREAERLGYSSLWVSDHIALPTTTESRYPFTPDGHFPVPPESPILDPFCTLAAAAAVTERVRLGISALVVPYRHPVLLAKLAATTDFLSSGRLILGVGIGWHAEEFKLLGAPFEDRIAFSNETLEFLRAAWASSGPVSFAGRFVQLTDTYLNPPPVQGAALPIWVTGRGDSALETVARFGHAWHCHVFGSVPADLKRDLARANERARRQIELTIYAPIAFDTADPRAAGGEDAFWERNTIKGPSEYIASVLGQFVAIGANHIVVRLGDEQTSTEAALAKFMDEVRPNL